MEGCLLDADFPLVAQGDVSLVWCPTGDMIRYFMTKPLQGDLFRKNRDHIMGMIPAKDLEPGKAHPRKIHPGKGKPRKVKEYIFLSLDLPVGQHHRSVLGEVKNGKWIDTSTCNLLETHIHETIIRWDDGCISI